MCGWEWNLLFVVMRQRPPRSTRTGTLLTYTTLVRSVAKYSALNKKVQIRVSAIEGEPNLRASELDVASVRLKRVGMVARRSSYHDTFLMGERVFPVCAIGRAHV